MQLYEVKDISLAPGGHRKIEWVRHNMPLLRGLEDLICEKTGINTMTAEDPMTCVAIGTGKYVEFLSGKRDEQ